MAELFVVKIKYFLSVSGEFIYSFLRPDYGIKKMLFICDNPLKFVNPSTQQSEPINEGMVSSNLHVQLLKNFKAGVVPDEKYFVYLVEERIL